MACSKKVLIAGFGSLLQGDDSFGIRLLASVEAELRRIGGIDVLEASTNGIMMVQQLMEGYDVLIILDAISMGGEPGELYVLELEDVKSSSNDYVTSIAQLHEINPQSALQIAKALKVLPPRVYFIGCEPAAIDFTLEVSPPMYKCLERARRALLTLVTSVCSGNEGPRT
ncbi:MAG: hydrogenase maturation protease [Desulfurococcales archaeon]|nr:hydrogenase maturation protease [Desulfurococcales archaeon]